MRGERKREALRRERKDGVGDELLSNDGTDDQTKAVTAGRSDRQEAVIRFELLRHKARKQIEKRKKRRGEKEFHLQTSSFAATVD